MAEEDDLEPGPKRKLNLVMLGAIGGGALILGIVLGVVVGGFVLPPLLAPGPPPPPEMVTVQEDLETLTVNLRGGDGLQVMTIRVVAELETEFPKQVSIWRPAFRDSVVMLGSDFTADEMQAMSTQNRFKRELRHRFNLSISNAEVTSIYFAEMIIR